MPSPFPGMDPYIEGQKWRGFHAGLTNVIRDLLVESLRPRYIVDVETYVYIRNGDDEVVQVVGPDVFVVERETTVTFQEAAATALAAPTRTYTLPLPRRVTQRYLTIVTRDTQRVVSIIEVLSPWNKQGDGQRDYLAKRNNILASETHLVEIDLLRGGTRLPTVEPLEPADYYAFVSRSERRPKVDVHAWTLRQPLPAIPIPLIGNDEQATLQLQEALTLTYDRAGYDYALNYQAEPAPPLAEADAEWTRGILDID